MFLADFRLVYIIENLIKSCTLADVMFDTDSVKFGLICGIGIYKARISLYNHFIIAGRREGYYDQYRNL